MASRKLSAVELAEAEEVSPAASATTRKLSEAEIAGATPIDESTTESPSVLESLGRGALQSVTFDFADELAGAVESALSRKTYRQARDESRAAFRRAQETNPKAFLTGQIGGGVVSAFVPGLGAAKAATATKAALGAAKFGALSGLGSSEADLTRGDIGGALLDTAKGAVASGLLGAGVHKVVHGPPGRYLGRKLEESNLRGAARGIFEGESTAKLSLAKKFGARAGNDLEVFKPAYEAAPRQLRKALSVTAASNPGRAAAELSERMSQIADETAPIYQAIDRKAGGVAVPVLAKKVDSLISAFQAEGQDTMRAAAQSIKDRLTRTFPENYEDVMTAAGKVYRTAKMVPAQSVRNFVSDIGSRAWVMDPLVAAPLNARAQQRIYHELLSAIEDAGRRAGQDVGKLRGLNREMAMWIPAKQALIERAQKEAAGRSSLGTTLLKTALVGGGFAGGGPAGGLAGLAAGAAAPLGRRALREARYRLAEEILSARGDARAARLAGLKLIGAERGLESGLHGGETR